MKDSKLDFTRFFPEVYQAVAGDDFVVYAYMNDGSVRMYDVKPMLARGGVFEQLRNEEFFRKTLTVLNGSIAWDMGGNRNEYECIDIDPCEVFASPVISDIPNVSNSEALI